MRILKKLKNWMTVYLFRRRTTWNYRILKASEYQKKCNLDNLCWTEKIILAEIAMLSNQKYCYANNEHFSKLLGIRKDSASRTVCKLIKKGYLISSIKYKQNIKKVEQRILQVNWKLINNFKDTSAPNNNAPICTNADTPLPRSLPPSRHGSLYPLGTKA